MPYEKFRTVLRSCLLATSFFLAAMPGLSNAYFNLLPTVPPDEYGNLLISRTSVSNNIKPVGFSHWTHRTKFTCRVCHFELEFNMLVNTSEITEAANKAGKYCGAQSCHDGKAAFGHEQPHCEKCHSGDRGYGKELFPQLQGLPVAKYGNGYDWVKAIDGGKIKPVHYLTTKPPEVSVLKTFNLAAHWNSIPPSIFPHKAHAAWLDCSNCHPDIFNLKKNVVKKYTMVGMIKRREYCGVCHLTVAFSLKDCQRCHVERTK